MANLNKSWVVCEERVPEDGRLDKDHHVLRRDEPIHLKTETFFLLCQQRLDPSATFYLRVGS
jgi:hypothetical protein